MNRSTTQPTVQIGLALNPFITDLRKFSVTMPDGREFTGSVALAAGSGWNAIPDGWPHASWGPTAEEACLNAARMIFGG